MPASKVFSKIPQGAKEKKLEEREITEQLLSRLAYDNYSVTVEDRPDCIANVAGKSIGIEVTEYYADFSKRGSKEREKWGAWLKVAKEIKKRLLAIDEGYYRYLYAAVHFNKNFFIHRKYSVLLEKKCFDELLSLLGNNKLSKGKEKSIQDFKEYPKLKEIIEGIFLRNTSPIEYTWWWEGTLQSGMVTNGKNALKNIIDNKNSLVKGYRNQYDQKWLIIYAKGLGLSDVYYEHNDEIAIKHGEVIIKQDGISQESKQRKVAEYGSAFFDYIFLWDKFSESIFQLHPYYKKIFYYKNTRFWLHINHLPIK